MTKTHRRLGFRSDSARHPSTSSSCRAATHASLRSEVNATPLSSADTSTVPPPTNPPSENLEH